MRHFRNMDEVGADLPPNLRRAVGESVRSLLDAYGNDYDPDDCGWVVLVDEATTEAEAVELFGVGWAELITEGTVDDRRNGVFRTGWLANNQFGITIIAPDAPWLSSALRDRLAGDIIETLD